MARPYLDILISTLYLVTAPPLPSPAFTLESFGLTLADLLAMLRRENDLRLSPATQEQYRRGGYDMYVTVTEGVQKQVRCTMYTVGHSFNVHFNF